MCVCVLLTPVSCWEDERGASGACQETMLLASSHLGASVLPFLCSGMETALQPALPCRTIHPGVKGAGEEGEEKRVGGPGSPSSRQLCAMSREPWVPDHGHVTWPSCASVSPVVTGHVALRDSDCKVAAGLVTCTVEPWGIRRAARLISTPSPCRPPGVGKPRLREQAPHLPGRMLPGLWPWLRGVRPLRQCRHPV